MRYPNVYICANQKTVYWKSRRFILPISATGGAQLFGKLDALLKPVRDHHKQRFLLGLDVVPEPVTNIIGGAFAFLMFRKIYAKLFAALAFFTVLTVVTQLYLSRDHARAGASSDVYTVVFGSVLLYAIAAWHEIGHAAACQKVGIRADAFGVGFYLFLPVFYTKTSMIGIISRSDRLLVLSGGLYFQLLASAGLAAIAAAFDSQLLWMIFRCNAVLIFINALPVLRMDGQKIVQELLPLASRRMARAVEAVACTLNIVVLGGLGLGFGLPHSAACCRIVGREFVYNAHCGASDWRYLAFSSGRRTHV